MASDVVGSNNLNNLGLKNKRILPNNGIIIKIHLVINFFLLTSIYFSSLERYDLITKNIIKAKTKTFRTSSITPLPAKDIFESSRKVNTNKSSVISWKYI